MFLKLTEFILTFLGGGIIPRAEKKIINKGAVGKDCNVFLKKEISKMTTANMSLPEPHLQTGVGVEGIS